MAVSEGVDGVEEFVYRISTAEEWEALQRTGTSFGGELDKSSGFIHLSNLHQVQSTLQNFFLNSKSDLYLLQIDSKKCCSFLEGAGSIATTLFKRWASSAKSSNLNEGVHVDFIFISFSLPSAFNSVEPNMI
ncbi:hypothetical protein F0562_021498 [Nyssa sinensis]|uniref:DUF952 domain-containing protein n=1 Tax=Nyssa sinensis TaxID=561372 RepID=A0A5J5BMK1_9ASTE|nr:hypothetical protein F0562_021498 [Nyssa sinensis]